MAELISDGNQTVYKTDYVLTADATAGLIIPVGDMVGVCEVGGATGDTVALSLTGKWEEVTVDTFAVGDKVYVDASGVVSATNTNVFAGTCVDFSTGFVTFELGR